MYTHPEVLPTPASASRRGAAAFLAAAAALALVIVGSSTASAAPTKVGLGTADSFAVLAGAGVTDTGPTTLNGDLGTFPDTSITGSGSITVNGTNHEGDLVTQGAKNDLVTAYDNAAGQGPTSPIAADLAGQNLKTGVYNSASQLMLTGELTLDAEGDPNAVFVFQAGSDLIVGPGASVAMVNGAQACNVYWQVGSSASLDTGVSFKGTVMALTSITVATGSTVEGRLLARNGTVTLDTNTVTRPSCSVSPLGNVDTGDGSVAAADAGWADLTTTQSVGVIGLGVLALAAVAAIAVRSRSRGMNRAAGYGVTQGHGSAGGGSHDRSTPPRKG